MIIFTFLALIGFLATLMWLFTQTFTKKAFWFARNEKKVSIAAVVMILCLAVLAFAGQNT